MHPLIQNFHHYLMHEKRYAQHTVRFYISDIQQFESFAQENIIDFPHLVSHTHIRQYIACLGQKNLAAQSINRKLSSLRRFYKFLQKNKILENNPLTLVQPVKARKKLQLPFSKQEMQQLFSQETIFSNDFDGIRDRLIIDLLYQTGMRRAELINLQLKAIDFAQSQIKVLGKRNKERIIPLSDKMLEKIQQYIQLRNTLEINTDSTLIITKKGKKTSEKFVYNTVNRYLSLITTKVKRSPHMLRHTFATHLLDEGAELNAVKELLGHASLASTQIYTHSSLEKLKKMYNHTHPRSVKK